VTCDNETPVWLISADSATEFATDERCFITELLNSPLSPQTSLALARVEPGVTTQLHSLNGVSETYVLRRGSGLMEVDGRQHAVSAGDQVVIAANIPQRITNNGAVDLEFYCVCTPRFTVDCYVNLEVS